MIRTFSLLLIFFYSCQSPTSPNSGWQKTFQNNEKGEVMFGDKSKLFEAVRLGYPIRLGWGGGRVEHVCDAEFLTIFQDEVFAQIKPIIGQEPRIDNDSIKIRFRTENHWTTMRGTNGYLNNLMTNYMQDTIVGSPRDRIGATTWYVLYPNQASQIDPRPLWRASSPNWEKWNQTQE